MSGFKKNSGQGINRESRHAWLANVFVQSKTTPTKIFTKYLLKFNH